MSEKTTNSAVTGTIRSDHGTGVVRVEGRYDTDVDDLWSALTEPERLARWVADVQGDRAGKAPERWRSASLRTGSCCGPGPGPSRP